MKIFLGAALILIIIAVGAFFVRQQRSSQPNLPTPVKPVAAIRYLALGDSCTIGQGVNENERWPNQLIDKLRADDVDIELVGNPSVTGYTTQDLIERELPLIKSTNANLVSILIGVNDYVRGISKETFHKNLRVILDTTQSNISKERIFLVTIPDYGKTPAGAQFGDPAVSAQAIKEFNEIIVQEGISRGIVTVDIYSISQGVANDKSLVASDGLHPSGKQYKSWTEAIYGSLTKANTFK